MSRKRRTYDSTSRKAGAAATRLAILTAARQLFLERGYAGTTMPSIAATAGVALDTVYATVGKKPALFRLLVETAISGRDNPVPADERDYVQAIRAERTAEGKLRIYAAALRLIQARLAPLFQVLQTAALLDSDLQDLWRQISQRRANNMRLFVRDLAATGSLRTDLDEQTAADIVWSMNSSEFYILLVQQRGWSEERFESWLVDAWTRLLLR
ncbi:MAG TPA: helix-turn-helix domain-containing protein [Chthoniobacterales bacterium]|nr:helix-turn-helix domain-containing protein [Chthoniobacterales bacterium]